MDQFYIYIYLDPRKSGKYCYDNFCFLLEPFYIGKGKDKRYIIDHGRNDLFKNKIKKIKKSNLEPIVFKLYENLDENKSFKLEKKLIKEMGRFDLNLGVLLNMTDGGEGLSGYNHLKETKIKISEKLKGICLSEETKNKMSKTRKEKFKNGELNQKGENHNNFGKQYSEETKNKMSKTRKEKFKNGELSYEKGKSPYHKLSEKQVIQIKLLLKEGKLTQKEIAEIFNVDKSTISMINTGKIWSYIEI